jgi:hypothetical protein
LAINRSATWHSNQRLLGTRRSHVPLVLSFLLLIALIASLKSATPPSTTSLGDGFQDAPAFTSPIGASPVLDSKSSTWSTWLGGSSTSLGPARALLYAFGLPIYYADATTPRVRVIVDNEPDWGTNDLSQQLVPIPANAVANSGSDGKIVIVDSTAGKVYDLWAAQVVNGQWHAAWGGVYALDGSGSSPNPDYTSTTREGVPVATPWPQPTSRDTGSGVSSYQGVVRTREIANGSIDHALVFATDHACGPSSTGPYRFPATTTDGNYTGSDCIPEGTRIQLDPSINVDAIPGITPGEKAVAKALQRYGAYVNDNSPDRMSFAFEAPKTGTVDPYPAAGFTGDYYNMPHIPWSSIRVLRNWHGT